MNQGCVRLIGQDSADDAVQWWFFREYGRWAFARGGRCRTMREARKLIREARVECERDRAAFWARPTHELLEDGSLIPVRGRSPYDSFYS